MREKITFTSLFAGLAASLVSTASASEINFAPPLRLEVPECSQLEGPELVDYDGDGKLDLLSGVYSGNLLFRKNISTNEAPKFAKPLKLQSGGKDIKVKHW